MKNVVNTILAVVIIASFAFDIVEANALVWGIPSSIITVASSILLAVAQFVQKLKMFNETEVIDFGEFLQEGNMAAKHSADTEVAFREWKSKR